MNRREHSAKLPLEAAVQLSGIALLIIVLVLSVALAADVGDSLTRNTIRLSLAWYAVALCLMMHLQAIDWAVTTARGRLARWCWTWAAACFLIHFAVAFHFFDDWSHQHAFERTRMVSGFGEGLYVSYLFTVLWTSDVAYWWLFPSRYAIRSPWIDRFLHGFMLLIVFNGVVVFDDGAIRWAGVAMFLLLALVWVLPKSRQPRSIS